MAASSHNQRPPVARRHQIAIRHNLRTGLRQIRKQSCRTCRKHPEREPLHRLGCDAQVHFIRAVEQNDIAAVFIARGNCLRGFLRALLQNLHRNRPRPQSVCLQAVERCKPVLRLFG